MNMTAVEVASLHHQVASMMGCRTFHIFVSLHFLVFQEGEGTKET